MNIIVMKVLKYTIIPIALLIGAAIYRKFPNIKQDNPVEEFVEEMIERKTGIDIDLSPGSKEK